MNIPNIRLLNQQLVAPLFSDAHDLVGWMGMVQAQEYRMMRWAVALRLKSPKMEAFRKAYDSGRIVRTHLFRCTWQLVTAEDLRWMSRLCAEKNKRAINGYLKTYGLDISERQYERFNDLVSQVLSGTDSMLKDDLVSSLKEMGFCVDSHTFSIYLRRAEFDGVICSGRLDARQNTYALVEKRIPRFDELSHEESLMMLARKYFRSHSPATMQDFIWWTGLAARDCQKAVCFVGKELSEYIHDGETYYIYRDCRIRGCRGKTLLLPSYDEYLIGYKSRFHVIENDFRSYAFSNNGLFYPVIVSDGRIVGNWHPQKKNTCFFREEYRTDIEGAFGEYLRFVSS
ncbi:winged helix DNA-binding domain-containing protein [Xylanibacter muris]|uniref:Winged helix DNA-binding domain-containing protein n=1 Tax=Xylanibacter muris TaxID=2736290 RepID=A0ABX2AR13_9BACT|nr:winged helix DNA-binding domain-containing protein [Xylanibacter muris]NPD92987.1 winged helix DNA-binding domain-containing protein [Xylanibacter muris]